MIERGRIRRPLPIRLNPLGESHMNYFLLEPDVPFGLGDAAEFDQNPAAVVKGVRSFTRIDLVLWEVPAADLTTIQGVYLMSLPLASSLQGFTGLRKAPFTLSFEPQMFELGAFEGESLPGLVCFEVTGTVATADFAHAADAPGLIVTEPVLRHLEGFNLDGCTVRPYTSPAR